MSFHFSLSVSCLGEAYLLACGTGSLVLPALSPALLTLPGDRSIGEDSTEDDWTRRGELTENRGCFIAGECLELLGELPCGLPEAEGEEYGRGLVLLLLTVLANGVLLDFSGERDLVVGFRS